MKTIDLEDLVETKEEISLLHKMKNQILYALMNQQKVKVPGLGIAQLLKVRAANRYSSTTVFKISIDMDDSLRVKIENSNTPKED